MRRLAALAITLALAWLAVTRLGHSHAGGTALALGVALLAASIVGWLCQFVRLPAITGYLTLGIVCGSSFANIITASMAADLQVASSLAVVVVAMIAGLHVPVEKWRPRLLHVLAFSAFTMAGTWLALGVVLGTAWPWLPIAPQLYGGERMLAAGVTALLLVGASPAVTIAVIAESRAQGALSTLATEVVVSMEIVVVTLATLAHAFARVTFGEAVATPFAALATAVWSTVGAVAFGALCGALFTFYLRVVGREVTVALLALCGALTGFAAPFGLDPFMAGLASGIVVRIVRPQAADVLHDVMESGAMPALVLFFAATGAAFHLEAVALTGVLAIGVSLVRLGAIRASTRLAARATGDDSRASRLVWRALIPTTGATVGLVALAAADLPEWGPRLQALIIAVVAINQLIGPIIFRATLAAAGEIESNAPALIVVSNREPWVHERDDEGRITARQTPGGVSVALDALMRERGGVWIAHGAGSADREVVDENGSVAVPPDAPAYRLRRLWLTPAQEEHYYAGFSNSALWPLCHQAHVRPVFKEEDWQAYRHVNRLFARAAAVEAPADASVFFNDYHLALAGKYLRQRRPRLRTALFWHIPWPDVDRLRICPWRRDILDGMLANDLVAFQLPRDQRHFLSAVIEELGATVSADAVHLGSRPVRVVAVPIGADFDRIEQLLAEDRVRDDMHRLSTELGLAGKIVGVGVDRLDYTKGIPERIAAIERLLTDQPDLAGRFVFVQVGVPSRSDVHGYAEISAEIDGLVAQLNERFGGEGRTGPLLYLKHAFQLPDLVALYRLADICIVSSLHDGMNLVAKEFVAARDDLDGVLVLSELAGAAEELAEALIINPYDERGFAAAIGRAIEMPEWERRRRMQALRRRVAGRDVLSWASDILNRLERRKGLGFLSG